MILRMSSVEDVNENSDVTVDFNYDPVGGTGAPESWHFLCL